MDASGILVFSSLGVAVVVPDERSLMVALFMSMY